MDKKRAERFIYSNPRDLVLVSKGTGAPLIDDKSVTKDGVTVTVKRK